jgi:hypothetical protein
VVAAVIGTLGYLINFFDRTNSVTTLEFNLIEAVLETFWRFRLPTISRDSVGSVVPTPTLEVVVSTKRLAVPTSTLPVEPSMVMCVVPPCMLSNLKSPLLSSVKSVPDWKETVPEFAVILSAVSVTSETSSWTLSSGASALMWSSDV